MKWNPCTKLLQLTHPRWPCLTSSELSTLSCWFAFIPREEGGMTWDCAGNVCAASTGTQGGDVGDILVLGQGERPGWVPKGQEHPLGHPWFWRLSPADPLVGDPKNFLYSSLGVDRTIPKSCKMSSGHGLQSYMWGFQISFNSLIITWHSLGLHSLKYSWFTPRTNPQNLLLFFPAAPLLKEVQF